MERVYDEHASALFAFLLDLTRNEADARDLLQEIFLRLAKRPAVLENVRESRAFLIRVAHNLAIDQIRCRASRQRNYEALAEQKPLLFAPATDLEEQEFRGALAAALGQLPVEQRVVVHLKLWEEMTFEQIAETLGIPVNTAASRYRYGVDKLRERLRPLYEQSKHG